MSLFSVVRGLWWVASEVVDAARQLVAFTPGQDDYRAHLADVLAEKEAGEEVAEPQERIVIPDGPPISMSEFTLGKLHKCSEESCCCQDDERYEYLGPYESPEQFWDWEAGLIKPEPLIAPLNADEVAAVRRFLESSAAPGVSPVEAADNDPGVVPPPDATPGSLTSLTADELDWASYIVRRYAQSRVFDDDPDRRDELLRVAHKLDPNNAATLGNDPASVHDRAMRQRPIGESHHE